MLLQILTTRSMTAVINKSNVNTSKTDIFRSPPFQEEDLTAYAFANAYDYYSTGVYFCQFKAAP